MEKTLARKKRQGVKACLKKLKKSPRMMKMYCEFKIKAIAEKTSINNKRINRAMIKRQYGIPCTIKTVVKYLKQYYKLLGKTH